MSKNIHQVFIANPITSNTGTDLMYFGQSPYGTSNDAAMTYTNFSAQFGAPYTASALTSSNDTNVTITLGGSPTTALLHATSLTMGWAGQLSLARGGSNASLTASNGGIVYSTASALAILAGTVTSNLPLLSGSSAAPIWGSFALSLGGALTTAGALTTVGAFGATFNFTNTTNVTFPTSGTLATTADIPSFPLSLANGGTNASLTASNGGIFYSTASAGAILAGTATANLPLLSGLSSAPTWGSFPMVLGGNLTTAGAVTTVGAFGATFTFTNTTSVTFPTSGTLATTAQIVSPVDQTTGSVTLAPNTLYVIDNGASLVTLTFPATAAIGDTYKIIGKSSGGWKIAQLAGQSINYGSSTTTVGTGGSLASSNKYDCIEITCNTTNTTFTAYSGQGNLTVV